MDLASLPPFKNEPFTDFSTTESKRAMEGALERVRAELNRSYDLVIGGHRMRKGEPFASVNPARGRRKTSLCQLAPYQRD